MKSPKAITIWSLTLAALLILTGTWSTSAATNLTGTFKHPDGSPVNGKLIFLLSQPARLSDGSAQVVPMVKIFSVANGTLEPGAFVYGNDVLVPSGTYYLVRLVDNNNNLLFEQKWSIQGANLDLGTLTPTTTGVVMPDPLLKNVTSEQAVEGPVSFTAPVSVFTLTLHGNLNPGTPESYDLGNSTAPWREVIARGLHAKEIPWHDVKTYGAACDGTTDDTAVFQTAISAAGANAAAVYVPSGCTLKVAGESISWPAAPQSWGGHTLVLSGKLHLTSTLTINRPNTQIIGWLPYNTHPNAFIRWPAADIKFDAGVTPVLKVAASTVLLENLNFDGTCSGTCIELQDVSSVWVTMRHVYAHATSASPTVLDDAAFGFFCYWCGFANAGTGPSVQIRGVTSAAGQVFFHDLYLGGRGISVYQPSSANGGNVHVYRALYEGGNEPFINISDANGQLYISGIRLEDVAIADYLGGTATLIGNTGTHTSGVYVVNPRDAGQIVTGDKINGLTIKRLYVHTGITVGQSDSYVFEDGYGTRVAVPSALTNLAQHFYGKVGIGVSKDPLVQAKAQLDVSDGTGYGGTPHTSTRLLVQSADSFGTTLTIGSDTGKYGNIYFANPSSYSQGGIAFNHNSNEMSFYNSGSTVALFSPTLHKFYQPIYWYAGGSQPGILTHSNTGWRTYTFPDASGTLPLLSLTQTWSAQQTFGEPIVVTKATGTSPLTITSTTEVTNLNVQKCHGKDAIDFSSTLDFAAISAQSCTELTITATGAATNNAVAPSWPASLEAGLVGMMRVSAADTVAVRVCNVTASAVDPASQSFAGRVVK